MSHKLLSFNSTENILAKIETLITESSLNHEIIVSWKVASNFYRLISSGYKEVRPNIALIKTCILKLSMHVKIILHFCSQCVREKWHAKSGCQKSKQGDENTKL